jgi:hypothetical protein
VTLREQLAVAVRGVGDPASFGQGAIAAYEALRPLLEGTRRDAFFGIVGEVVAGALLERDRAAAAEAAAPEIPRTGRGKGRNGFAQWQQWRTDHAEQIRRQKREQRARRKGKTA